MAAPICDPLTTEAALLPSPAPAAPGVLFVTMLKNAAVFGLGRGNAGIPLTIDPNPIMLPNPGVNPVPPPGVNPVLKFEGSNAPLPA